MSERQYSFTDGQYAGWSEVIPERFVIQSCELSANGDYWVIRSNSEDYVVHGMTEFCAPAVDDAGFCPVLLSES
ncbi:hypothetical protein EAH72_20475 [Pseudomonas caspiana]|nr:hypothetical protein EAH72_20475 [Pseudomonas caspiana]